MKTYVTLILIAVLTGCATTPSPPSPQFKHASQKYATVSRSMNRDSVYQLLGPPKGTDEKGRQHWWIEEGRNREDLWLRFGHDGEMTEYERGSARIN